MDVARTGAALLHDGRAGIFLGEGFELGGFVGGDAEHGGADLYGFALFEEDFGESSANWGGDVHGGFVGLDGGEQVAFGHGVAHCDGEGGDGDGFVGGARTDGLDGDGSGFLFDGLSQRRSISSISQQRSSVRLKEGSTAIWQEKS